MKTPKILFTEDAAELIIEAFGYYFNADGFIAEIKTEELALTSEGEYIHKKEFGGIKKGKNNLPMFLKNDLWTIMKLAGEK